MEYGISNTRAFAEIPGNTRRSLIACGLWLRAAIVGACGVLAGLVQLSEGALTPLATLALIGGGAALAVIGWKRACVVVDLADGTVTKHTAAPAPSGTRAVAGT